MSKLVVSLNITVDGFCGHEAVLADETHHLIASRLLSDADYLLLGRKTYELFNSFWPEAASNNSLPGWMQAFAKQLNDQPKLVSSATLLSADWQNTELIPTLHESLIHQLKQRGNLLVFGSPGLISFLASKQLVDEFYFLVQPLVAGKGMHLFREAIDFETYQLKLIEQQVSPSGVILLHYARIAA